MWWQKVSLKRVFCVAVFLSVIGIGGAAYAVDGTMTIENKTSVIINVGITHFGCLGIFDGIFTVCTPKGAISDLGPGKSVKIKWTGMGDSSGYTAVGKDTTKGSNFRGCDLGINGSVQFYFVSGVIFCRVK